MPYFSPNNDMTASWKVDTARLEACTEEIVIRVVTLNLRKIRFYNRYRDTVLAPLKLPLRLLLG